MPGGLQYSYFFQILFYMLIWVVFFVLRKDLRKQMLLTSLAVAPLGPVAELFYRRDYWQPQLFNGWTLGLEDVLWGFAIGGIGCVAFKVLAGKRHGEHRLSKHPWWPLKALLAGVAWMVTGTLLLGFNSIYVSAAGFVAGGLSFLLFERRDLLAGAIVNGFFVGFVLFAIDVILAALYPGLFQQWWLLDNLSGINLLGIPVEEAIWGFAWGFFVGPSHEFVIGREFQREPASRAGKPAVVDPLTAKKI